MSLLENITQDYKQAMRDKDELKKLTLNYIMSQAKYKKIELQKEVEDGDVVSIIRKEIKNTIETISFLEKANKPEEIEQENKKRKLLESYLPTTMNADQTKALIESIITKNNLTDIAKQRGLIMKEIMVNHKDQVDASLVNAVINQMIS